MYRFLYLFTIQLGVVNMRCRVITSETRKTLRVVGTMGHFNRPYAKLRPPPTIMRSRKVNGELLFQSYMLMYGTETGCETK